MNFLCNISRDFESIKPNIERIFKIWDERRTYDAKFIKELRTLMDGQFVYLSLISHIILLVGCFNKIHLKNKTFKQAKLNLILAHS